MLSQEQDTVVKGASCVKIDEAGGSDSYSELFAYKALWLNSKVRGFHDLGRAIIDEFLSTIEGYLPSAVVDWGIDEDCTWWFQYRHARVHFHLSSHATTFLVPEVTGAQSIWIETSLQQIKANIDRLLTVYSSHMSSFRDVAVLILLILEETSPNEGALINEVSHLDGRTEKQEVFQYLETYKPWSAISSNTATDYDIFGTNLPDCLSMVPDEYRILTVEPVRRDNLTKSWFMFQREIEANANRDDIKTLRRKCHPYMTVLERRGVGTIEREDLINEMVKPFLTFHGTSRGNVPSIIRHGFLMPGTMVDGKPIVSPRSGIAYRRGIYSSPSAEFALSFSKCHQYEPIRPNELPGLRLFVCATLMGRTYQGVRAHDGLMEGYDAHMAGMYEYIVHDARAILPCYVIHLDLVTEQAQKAILRVQQNPGLARFRGLASAQKLPGDIQREQEAKKQAALKWFPYGYGPSIATQFKVEEIGPVDEDDEPHRGLMYQELSKAYGRDHGRILTWMELIQEDDGMLVEMFREDAYVDNSNGG